LIATALSCSVSASALVVAKQGVATTRATRRILKNYYQLATEKQ